MAGLLDKRLWIVSGKGGVGKSTISAALALRSARAGRRTLVCEVNTQERISGRSMLPSSAFAAGVDTPNSMAESIA